MSYSNMAWRPNNLSPGGDLNAFDPGITLHLAWGPSNSSPVLFFFQLGNFWSNFWLLKK